MYLKEVSNKIKIMIGYKNENCLQQVYEKCKNKGNKLLREYAYELVVKKNFSFGR